MDDSVPVMLIATTDSASRRILGDELRRRYGADYEVVTCSGHAHGRAVLEGLRRWDRPVALILGCYGPLTVGDSISCGVPTVSIRPPNAPLW
ncbi:hypothetical protein [Arthrobacter sp. MAHUQ-56]